MALVTRQLRVRASAGLLLFCLALNVPGANAAPATSVPATAAFPREAARQIDTILAAEIEAGRIPGAVVLVGDRHGILYRRAAGRRSLEPPQAMTADTLFDLASLTKVVATTTAVLQLAERGRLDLDAPAARYWPAFGAAGKGGITPRALLAHVSGLPAGLRPARGASPQAVLAAIAALPPVAPPGSRVLYSDLNFIVLGEIVRRAGGVPLDTWCRAHVFAPLGMRTTGFEPRGTQLARLAPTARRPGPAGRPRVHDPLAASLGGIAGNAGLFSSAEDLARFARMLLADGHAPGGQVLQPASVAALAAPATAGAADDGDGAGGLRGLGWQLSGPLAANRDRLPPLGSLGHTGYTGTGLWIDRVSGRFVVILSNRVLMGSRGDAMPLRAQVLAVVASTLPPLAPSAIGTALPELAPALADALRLPAARGPVASGLDLLEAGGFAALAGMRVGLISNRSGFDARGRRTADVLAHAPEVKLSALFAPEHGFDIAVDAPVADSMDVATGLPVYSLYGRRRRINAATLSGLDALVFDLQDAGVRFFTYPATLDDALEAAATARIPLFVLDRPDPLGAARVGGPVLDASKHGFTAYYPLPLLPGMTVGELARLFNAHRQSAADLRVIPMAGYRRGMAFAATGLGWVPISPNLRDPATLDLYPETGLLEGADLSVGRGTPAPFTVVGAPWLDAPALAARLAAMDTGARFTPVDFVPTEGRHQGKLCHGVSVRIETRREPGRVGLALALALHAQHPGPFDLEAIRVSVGSDAVWRLLDAGAPLDAVVAQAETEAARFATERAPFLLYPD